MMIRQDFGFKIKIISDLQTQKDRKGAIFALFLQIVAEYVRNYS